jgi:beta-lactamase superfamily II metal-dependent hydrolase
MKRFLRISFLLLFWSIPLSAQQLRVYHIDVEQASATLFVAPGGKTLLVYSGKNGMGNRIKSVMDRAHVTAIDFFVLTHYHEDHDGGIDSLVALGVPVRETFDRGDKTSPPLPASRLIEPTFKAYQTAVGDDAQPLRRGGTVPLDPLMTVTCISSGGVVIGENQPVATGHDENDMSISLLITFGSFRYFIGGDIEAPTEQKIADRDLVKDVDVYVADHHGSDTSSIVPFLQDMTPRVIIISNGSNAGYHHPSQSTLTSFAVLAPPPPVFQTNKCMVGPPCGNVPDAFIADPQQTDQDGTILLTADSVAHSYTVAFDSGVSRSFPYRNGSGGGGGIVIESLLTNPPGEDSQNEAVTLKNRGTTSVSLVGWTLKDRSGLVWQLTGSIAAGQSKIIKRAGMAMTLNNNGDEIRLFDVSNVERDRFEYTSSTEASVIQTGH